MEEYKIVEEIAKALEENLAVINILDNKLNNYSNGDIKDISSYKSSIDNLKEAIDRVFNKIEYLYQDFQSIATFNIVNIGPYLAKILTNLTGEEFVFKKINYEAVVWDWNERIPEFIGEASALCYALVSSKIEDPLYRDNICLSNKNHINDSKDMICLGTIDYDSINHQNIINDMLSFYRMEFSQKIKLLAINKDYSDYIYLFIDSLIKYKIEHSLTELSIEDIETIYQEIIKNDVISLKRSIK